MKAEEVDCSSLRELIDDKIHDERNRDILKRRLIDGVADVGDSEFLEAVQGMNAQDAWLLMDELMETLKVVNPRLYSGVIRQLG